MNLQITRKLIVQDETCKFAFILRETLLSVRMSMDSTYSEIQINAHYTLRILSEKRESGKKPSSDYPEIIKAMLWEIVLIIKKTRLNSVDI